MLRDPKRALVILAAICLPLASCDADRHGADPRARIDTLLPVNGTRLFVHAEGRGEPIVIVHGGPLLDHGYLVEPLRPLADRYRLVFYDQRSSGRSEGGADRVSIRLDTLVADLEAIRRAMELDRVHVLGHSWGGLLALEYALAHPDRLRSLVLVSPMPPSAAQWREEESALRAALTPRDTTGMGVLRASSAFRAGEPAAIERMLQLSFRSQLHDPSLADSLRFHLADDYRERSRRFSHIMVDLASYDLREALTKLPVPTLLIYGAEEVGATSGAAAYARALPEATIERIRRAKHFPFLERPAEFRRIVEGFLRSSRGARTRPAVSSGSTSTRRGSATLPHGDDPDVRNSPAG